MGRWTGVPLPLRVSVAGLVAVFAYGTAVHVVQLVGEGLDVYGGLPGWLRAYFVSLTLLDPLAAVLLLRRSRLGPLLGSVVLVSDALANFVANYVFDPASGVTVGRVGQGFISMLALGSVYMAVRLRPHLRRSSSGLCR